MIQVRFDKESSERLVMVVDPPVPRETGDASRAADWLLGILGHPPPTPLADGQSTQPSPESR